MRLAALPVFDVVAWVGWDELVVGDNKLQDFGLYSVIDPRTMHLPGEWSELALIEEETSFP